MALPPVRHISPVMGFHFAVFLFADAQDGPMLEAVGEGKLQLPFEMEMEVRKYE